MVTDETYASLLELAVDAAREAGRMLLDKRPAAGPDVVQTKSSPTDVVTQMDRASERLSTPDPRCKIQNASFSPRFGAR